jgi:hypothetical protein
MPHGCNYVTLIPRRKERKYILNFEETGKFYLAVYFEIYVDI